jgi:hypothetical protein
MRDPSRHTVRRGARSERVSPTGGFREAENQQNPLTPGERELPIPTTVRPASPPWRSLGLAQILTGHSRESRSSCQDFVFGSNECISDSLDLRDYDRSRAANQLRKVDVLYMFILEVRDG